MVLLGTMINGIAIIIGSILGSFYRNIPEKMKQTILQAISLVVIVMGMGMALKSNQMVLVVASLVLGGILGEKWRLEEKLNQLGGWLERRIGTPKNGGIAQAFVTTTLVYAVGAMAIVGALDSGLRNDHNILITKSLLDGISAIFFTSTLGIGVIFSSIPVMLYQGMIALFAAQIQAWIPSLLLDQLINELTGTGGILILAIGLNLIPITNIRVANLLPSLIFTIIFVVTGCYSLS